MIQKSSGLIVVKKQDPPTPNPQEKKKSHNKITGALYENVMEHFMSNTVTNHLKGKAS